MVETKLTPLYVKTAAQKFDFKTIFLLDIQRKGVTSIGAIPECINLVTLDLSRNNLSNISGLEKCIQLKVLNLSYNKLLSVSVLQSLSEL
jgi:Leucine-rich repeat (LRR) protein